jgi:hypothetical protein
VVFWGNQSRRPGGGCVCVSQQQTSRDNRIIDFWCIWAAVGGGRLNKLRIPRTDISDKKDENDNKEGRRRNVEFDCHPIVMFCSTDLFLLWLKAFYGWLQVRPKTKNLSFWLSRPSSRSSRSVSPFCLPRAPFVGCLYFAAVSVPPAAGSDRRVSVCVGLIRS